MTIAVAGPRGRLGKWLVDHHECIPLLCDITDPESIEKAVDIVKPSVIINCAAYTMVDDAELEENHEKALAINLRGPANLRQAFMGFFVQMSTGFVFKGDRGPYKENDFREPVNHYGWTKFGGEEAANMKEPTLIIRTLDLYSPAGNDLVRAIRDTLEMEVAKPLPDYLYKTPTYVPHLAEGVMAAVSAGLSGYLHIAGSRTINTMEWGQMIAESFGHNPDLILPGKVAGTAPRPLRGGLKTDHAKSLDIPIFSPEDGLEALAQWESVDVD